MYRTWYERKVGERNALQTQLNTITKDLEIAESDFKDIEEAQLVIQLVSKQTQEHLKYHIEDLVSKALYAVFPDPYTLQVSFELKRGKTEAKLSFYRDGQPVSPGDGSGGGAVDVAALAIRAALWAIGSTNNTIILDEPFKCLSKEYQPLAGEMLKELSKELNLQFIIVTHNSNIIDAADKVFKVRLQKPVGEKYGFSTMKEITE